MQQSQKLKAIEYIFTSNKEKELSYSKNHSFIVEDKIRNKSYQVIKEKYIGFDILEGVKIYNQVGDKFTVYNFYYKLMGINFYLKSFLNESRWGNVPNQIKFKTIFKILDSKAFINSILDFIDNEKSNGNIHKEQEQIKEVLKDISKSKGKFDIIKFPLTYNFGKYLSSYNQYYKTLKSLQNQYNIEDIQIFGGNITFTLSEIIEKKVSVEFKNNNLYINQEKVYFQRKNTIVFELIKLLFSYYENKSKNIIGFFDLEEYYKNNQSSYNELQKVKFNYEYLRKTISTKSKEIENKHGINNFLTINYSGITCQYLKEENN